MNLVAARLEARVESRGRGTVAGSPSAASSARGEGVPDGHGRGAGSKLCELCVSPAGEQSSRV